MSEVTQVLDRNGKPVVVGSRVRVVEIAAFLERDLPPDEWECVRSMLGQVFEVYEIDKWGARGSSIKVTASRSHLMRWNVSNLKVRVC